MHDGQYNTSDKIQQALSRLNELLPLPDRQRRLPAELIAIHRHVLNGFCMHGEPPTADELKARSLQQSLDGALLQLREQDLIVLHAESNRSNPLILGAYPFTLEQTSHAVRVNGNTVHAMCAVDALSIAPVFNTEVSIDSVCHVSGKKLHLIQAANDIQKDSDSDQVMVGIRWQSPGCCAAHSLCREMIFLAGEENASTWQGDEQETKELFTLTEAIALGTRFFAPLLHS